MCADALDTVSRSGRGYDEALGEYKQRRDEPVLPMYEFTGQLADLAVPPPPETQQLLGRDRRNQTALDEFANIFAGAVPVPAFFNPAHIDPWSVRTRNCPDDRRTRRRGGQDSSALLDPG